MKRFLLQTFGVTLLALAGVSGADASSIAILLDNPSQTAAPGDTLTFSGRIVNNENAVIDLNGIVVNLGSSWLLADGSPFFSGPLWVDPLSTTETFDLFQVVVDSSFGDPAGVYSGTVDLLGGVEGILGYDVSAQNLIGSAAFNVTVESGIPEPSTLLLGLSGLAIAWCSGRRATQKQPAAGQKR